MLFGDHSAEAVAAAEAAKNAVRSTANFNWTFIALLALVIVGVWIPQWKKTHGHEQYHRALRKIRRQDLHLRCK